MKLLVCGTDRKQVLRLLQATSSLPAEALSLELFESLESFFERLRHPITAGTAALIATGDAKDLQRVVPMGEFLWNIRVVVVLPDGSPETLRLARCLWPRYIAAADSDFSDVAAVLKRMAEGRKGIGRRRQAM